jgi:outer membrane protein OmpA-like peptidoglycan-associated protein
LVALLIGGFAWILLQQRATHRLLDQTTRQIGLDRDANVVRFKGLEDRLATAERRARDAEARAERAAADAEAQLERATTAEERARWAEEESSLALEARARAVEVARIERQRAQAALAEATRSYRAATSARQEAIAARAETAELLERKESELERLHGALGELAETRRTALGLVMNLGTGVEFDLDLAELRPENRELLARIAGVLMTAGDYHIQVFGHTDDQGDEDYNQELSERRAQSVVEYLVESGISQGIISARGLGESQPLVEGTDEAARQRNRRVEIAVISYNEEFAPPGQ